MIGRQDTEEASQSEADGALSHRIDATKLPAKGLQIVLNPDDEIRGQIADQMRLLSLKQFEAQLRVKPWHKDGVRVTGSLNAQLEQSCVVTLEPVPETIDAEIDAVFVPEDSKLAKPKISAETQELIIEADGDDAPEVFELPSLDVGKVALEFLALELNSYPRSTQADEVSSTLSEEGDFAEDDSEENPFAALAQIRDKL